MRLLRRTTSLLRLPRMMRPGGRQATRSQRMDADSGRHSSKFPVGRSASPTPRTTASGAKRSFAKWSGHENDIPREPSSVTDLGNGPKFVGRGRAKAEELKISGYLLEQHVGSDLDFAATCPSCREKWRDFVLHHDFADKRRGRNSDRKSTRLNSSHGYISYAVF